MRKINKIIIHCSATREGLEFNAKDIDRWHRQRGWRGIGYHYVIGLNGECWKGRPEGEVGAHCRKCNRDSIGVCYIGGLDNQGKPKDTRTDNQKGELIRLITALKLRFPNATIHGHNEFARKACPCFDVHSEYSTFNDRGDLNF